MYHNIPFDMRAYDQWVVWRYERTSTDKLTKVPYSARTGTHASVSRQETWATFDEAVAAALPGPNGEVSSYSGIGFVFTESDPFAGIDLDHTSDRVALDRQLKVYRDFDSYSEISPSGNGLHIIVKGKIPNGRRRSSIEVYSSARFFTMTGNVYNNAPIAERQELLTSLWQQMGGPVEATAAVSNELEEESDAQIVDRAKQAANGNKFVTLFEGRWAELYPSQSEADFALIDMIAFYTSNRAQVARIFRASALGQRGKAGRRDYVDRMIARSFDRQLAPVDAIGLRQNVEEHLAKAVPHSPLPPADSPYSRPPGLMGELAQFFYDAAPRPVPEIALAGAIGLMAGICGQAYNISNTGLNLYLMMLAPTGSGKEAIASGFDRIMDAIRTQVPAAHQFRGPAEIASGQALIRYMDKSPSFVSVIGEVGYRLRNMSSRHASAADVALKRTLLDLFGKSGHAQIFHPMIYADREKNTSAIRSPALTVLGESTPKVFYDVVDETMIEDGLLPRFVIIEYLGQRPDLNRRHAEIYPDARLVERFATLCAGSLRVMAMGNALKPVRVECEPEADALFSSFDRYANATINGTAQEVTKQLWNRAHINLLRLSALVAVGVDPHSPVITADHVVWARGIIVHTIGRVLQRFEQGMAGGNRDELKQAEEMRRVIGEFLSRDWPSLKTYCPSQEMHADRIVPLDYLHKRLPPLAAYRNDRNGAARALQRAVQALIETGSLRELGKAEAQQRYQTTARLFAIARPEVFIGPQTAGLNGP